MLTDPCASFQGEKGEPGPPGPEVHAVRPELSGGKQPCASLFQTEHLGLWDRI